MRAIIQTILLCILLAVLMLTVFFLVLFIQNTTKVTHVQIVDSLSYIYPWTQRYTVQGLIVSTAALLIVGGALATTRK